MVASARRPSRTGCRRALGGARSRGASWGSRRWVDRPGEVRPEDALDVAAVDSFLKERVAGLSGEPEVAQFPGGASNLTYQLRYAARDLILRRPPAGVKAKSAHDVLREARVMAALRPVYPYVPAILALCDDHAVIGCDFYVMERLVGIIPRRDLPRGLGLTPEGDAHALPQRARQADRAPRARSRGERARRSRQGRGLCRAAGRGLERTLAAGADRRCRADPPTCSPGSPAPCQHARSPSG